MHKNVEMAARARARLVQNTRAGGTQTLYRSQQIRNFQRHVMQPFASLVNKFGDDGVGLGWLQQLDSRTRPAAASPR